jgi:hypothetical protein
VKAKAMYRWKIARVRGELVRHFAWALREHVARRRGKSTWIRYRLTAWLLAVTDDRQWTVPHQTRAQRLVRRLLGRQVREWVLEETNVTEKPAEKPER